MSSASLAGLVGLVGCSGFCLTLHAQFIGRALSARASCVQPEADR